MSSILDTFFCLYLYILVLGFEKLLLDTIIDTRYYELTLSLTFSYILTRASVFLLVIFSIRDSFQIRMRVFCWF